MLIDFFYALRAARLPVSVKEFLTLLECLKADVVGPLNPEACTLDDFYFLARTALVKDEKHFDKFDRAFAAYFHGVQELADFSREIPADWLRREFERLLSEERKAQAPRLDWDELMETLKKRLEEQKERHEGGSKWIGTGGTSPFGHGGHNPQGIRIGGKGATAARSRSGSSASTATTTTPRSWARATSRWRCGGCAGSRARATSSSSTCPTRSAPPRPTPATWTCAWSPSATTRSRCCC